VNAAAQPFAQFAYRRSADQGRGAPVRHPVIIVGAGPVGLALAIDLRQRDVPVILLDASDRIGDGSRAICFAKRTLEIFDRLGVADPMLEKGVEWQVGKVFQREELLYQFDLLPEDGHRMPAFINLQQYYVEKYLVDRALELGVDIRWRNQVVGVVPRGDGAGLNIATPDGPYRLEADWLVACDGSRSPIRSMMKLDFAGEQFDDQFLIADVRMTAEFPVERWFWFDPPFHAGQSCLLHKQPDDIWRIDLQLSPDADTEHERKPEVVRPRIEKMLGHAEFELEWVSIYRFQCRRLERFVHGRVVFAGDAAHQVSPFGARGANSGVQDADNLGWKLAAVLSGAPAALIDTYHDERSEASDENILNSTRATDFIAPRSAAERLFRDAALALAKDAPFARRMVLHADATVDARRGGVDWWSTAWSACARLRADVAGWSAGLSERGPVSGIFAADRGRPGAEGSSRCVDAADWRRRRDVARCAGPVRAALRRHGRLLLSAAPGRACCRAVQGVRRCAHRSGGDPRDGRPRLMLDVENRFADPDAAYRAIVMAHRGLSDEQSAALNAALVLILANQLGDQAALEQAIVLAGGSLANLSPSDPAASR
jgi:3-(3-hydroxy-phenyl)propionate hydroxylase